MPYLKPKDLYARLRNQEYKPVYLFAGEETYQQEEAWRFLERKFGVDSLNMEIFYCGELSISDLILAAQTHPFMAEKRLLVVKDAHKLKSADAEALSQFLRNPLDTVCILFLWPERVKRENKNSLLFKAAEAAGEVVEFKALYDSELPSWVKGKIKEQSKTISDEAVELLITESGSSLLDLSNEIEKLVLYAARKNEISAADVESLSGHTRQSNLNNLADSIESGKTVAALKITENLMSEGEMPLKILATVYRVLRRLLMARSLMEEKNSSRADIQRELYLNAYFDRNFFNNLSKFTPVRLKKYIGLVLKADTELKSSSRPEQMVLEELILSLGN